MSTRSITVVSDEVGRALVTIYCHSDGYPEGHGADLARIIQKDRILVNGITESNQKENASNGMGCLAATIVAGLKTEIGGIYLKPDPEGDYGQEYEYHIWKNRARIVKMEKDARRRMIFDGDWNQFYDFCVSQYLSLFAA